MRKNRLPLRIISFFIAALTAVSCSFVLFSCKEQETYIKTFPSIGDIEYKTEDYLKVPELSEVFVRRSEVDAKVEYALASVLLDKAEYTKYSDIGSAKVEQYDIVNISYTGFPVDEAIELSETVLAELTNSQISSGTELVVGSGKFVGGYFGEDDTKKAKGFEEQLIGTDVGSIKYVSVIYPDDYATVPLRGVAIEYAVTVNSLRRPDMGELTDEICLERTGYESVDAYRKYLEEYYLGQAAYDAFVKKCEIIGHPEEMVNIYIDKYIHDKILDAYDNKTFTEKEYMKIYDDFYSKMYDEALVWADEMAEQRVIYNYLFEVCEIELDDEVFEEMLSEDWEENSGEYQAQYGITKKSDLVNYFGKDELKTVYKYDMMLRVLPTMINGI